jgi:hypothetical protein
LPHPIVPRRGGVRGRAEQQVVLLKDKKVDDFLNRLGLKLATKAPSEKYPYQFKGVNDASINAFALPGAGHGSSARRSCLFRFRGARGRVRRLSAKLPECGELDPIRAAVIGHH